MGVSTTHRINLSMWILIYSFSDTYYVWAACGFGRVDHHRPISKEDLEKIQSCYNPSSPDPKSLQQVVWFNLMFHLIRRGRENLRLLTKQTFAVQADATGKKYVYQALDELDKNHRGKDQPDDSPGEGRMYERPNSPYCPVKTFELYLSKLNPSLSCLWQRPKARESFVSGNIRTLGKTKLTVSLGN